MGRTAASFKRKLPRYKPQPKVLVLCEDSKSGKTYLEDAAVHFRSNAQVEIAHCGVTHPSGIIEHAIARQSKFDKVYCAIDRDTHLCFDKALLMAKKHEKIKVIASYPCFEFWLLLHFGHNRKPFTRTGKNSPGELVAKALRAKPGMEDYDKSANNRYFHILLGQPFNTARQLAPRVLKEAENDGEPNPSTEVHLLMDAFEKLSAPQE